MLAWAGRTRAAGVAWHSLALLSFLLKSAARTHTRNLLRRVEVVETGHAEALQALKLPMTDLEDALQAVAALKHRADLIVTRDRRDFRGSPVPAVSPVAFLERVEPR